MKKLFLFLLISVFAIEIAYTQNTSPTDVGTPCFINEFVMGHVYANGIHYVALDLPWEDGRLEMYDDNCNFLGLLATLPNFGPSGFESNFLDIDMLYYDNSLYFYAEIDDGDESAILRYDLNTNIIDINNRLSFKGSGGGVTAFGIFDNKLYISFATINNNFTVAVAADWNNPITAQYDVSTGNIQTFIFKMNATNMSNPILFSHLKDPAFKHIVVENGFLGVHNGNLLLRVRRDSQEVGTNNGIDRDIFFVEIDLTTGAVVRKEFYYGDATVEIVPNGDLILTLASYNYTPTGGSLVNVTRDVVYLLDSDWNEKINSGVRMSDNGNYLRNIHITDNFIIIEGGLRNYEYTSNDYTGEQAWMYFYLRPTNLQRTFIASGEMVERWPNIIGPISRFKKYDFTDNGFSAIGSYYWHSGPPIKQSNSQIVELNGIPLEVLATNESRAVLYRRTIVIPNETFTPQLGLNGVIVHMGKKIVNNVLTDSDQFDSVLVLDDTVDLSSWTMIDDSYTIGGESPEWSLWVDYAQYGIGNIQTNSLGDYFVDVAMYDWPDFINFSSARGLTRTKFQRIYLINEASLGIGDVSFDNLRVYPNPTKGMLYISSKENINFVQVTDMLGQTIKTLEANFDIQKIDLSNLSTGIYVVTISNGIHVETKKIIKK